MRCYLKKSIRPFVAAVLLLGLAVPSWAGAGPILWVGPPGGNWSNPANWMPMDVPDDITESAIITGATSFPQSIVLDVTVNIDRFQIENSMSTTTLIVSNQTLAIESSLGTSDIGVGGVVEVDVDGRISGLSQVSVLGGLLRFMGGTLEGSGALFVAAGGTVSIEGPASKMIMGRPFNIDGVLNWEDGDITLTNADININPAGMSNISANNTLMGVGLADFNNNGMTSYNNPVGNGIFQLPFICNGDVTVVDGNITLAGMADITDATFNLLAGTANCSFQASATFDSSMLQGAGTYSFVGTTVTLAGFTTEIGVGTNATADSDVFIEGNQILANFGTLTLDDSTIQGTAQVHNKPGGQLNLMNVELNTDAVIQNDAGATTDWQMGDLFLNDNGSFINLGTVNAAATGDISNNANGAPLFDNSGMFNKTNPGDINVQVPFINNGTLNVNNGNFVSQNVLNQNALLNINMPGILDINMGTFSQAASATATGNGLARFSGGTANIDGTYTVSGIHEILGGVVDFQTPNPVNITRMDLLGGELQIANSVTITTNMNWNLGSLLGPGSLIIDMPAGLQMETAGVKDLRSAAILQANGPINWRAGILSMDEASTLTFTENFSIEDDLILQAGGGPASQIINMGVLEKTMGLGTASVQVPFQSNGDIRVQSGELAFTTAIAHNTGRIELLNASFDFQQGIAIDSGEVSGVGKISGQVFFNGGFLKPGLMGNGIGTLNFSNDLGLGAGVVTELQIVSAGAPGVFDTVAIAGDVVLGGAANFLFDPGYVPSLGDLFAVVNASNLSGNFASVMLPPGQNGIEAQASINGNTFQVEVVAAAPPVNPQFFVARATPPEILFANPVGNTLNTTITGVDDEARIAVNLDGSQVLITNYVNENILLVDTGTNMPLSTTPGFQGPTDAAYNPSGTEAWVLNLPNVGLDSKRGPLPSFISRVNTSDGSIIGTVNDPCMNDGIEIASNPTTGEFYVIDGFGTICVFDGTGAFVASISLPAPTVNTMVVTLDGSSILVTDTSSSKLFKVDTNTLSFTELTLSDNPEDMDFDPLTGTVFITAGPDQVLRVDVNTLTELLAFTVAGAGGVQSITVLPNLGTGIVADQVGDQLYTFDLASGSSTAIAGFVGTPTDLADNDVVMLPPGGLRFTSTTYQVTEGTAQALVQVERVNGAAGPLNGVVTSMNDTAISGEDFFPVNQVVQFAAGEVGTKDVLVEIINDGQFEMDERLTLNLVNNDGTTQILTPADAELIILDNDTAFPSIFALGNTAFSVTEGAGQVGIEIQRSGGASGEVTLALEITPVNSTQGFDYQVPGSIVFNDGEAGPKMINIPILDDETAEVQESFQITLRVVQGSATLVMPTQATVTIRDNDPVEIVWTEMMQTVSEADAGKRMVSVLVQAETNRIADFPIFFNYQVGGTATPGMDHDLVPATQIVPIGSQSVFFRFNVLPDDLFEEDETVTLQLQSNGARPSEPSLFTLTILDDERREPTPRVRILSPMNGSQWGDAAPVPFLAEVLLEGEATLAWEICSSTGNCIRRTGNDFTQALPPGFYTAICIATNAATGDVSRPERARFVVVEGEPDPGVAIVSPKRRRVQLQEGESQTFTAAITNQGDSNPTVEWLMGANGSVLGTGLQYTQSFPQQGNFTVIARIAGAAGPGTEDWRDVEVTTEGNRRPDVEILAPANRAIVAPGEVVVFRGRANGPGNGPEVPLTWNFGNGDIAMGAVVENISFAQPGRYQVRLFGRLNDRRSSDEITLIVQEPGMAPLVGIFPVTDQQINPYDENIPNSGEVFFRPLVRNGRGFADFDYSWDFGNGQTSGARVPGIIRYEEEGTYQVTMTATSPSGMTSPVATRTVIVKRTDNNSFEPNNAFEQAASISAGQYPNLAVDDAGMDFYQIQIDREGQNLVLRFFQNEDALVEIFNADRQLVRTSTLGNSGRVQVVGLSPGTYFVKITAAVTAKRLDISYGLSIDVLNPSLYFADVESSASMDTEVGVVNLSNADASVEVLGFDAKGNLVETVPLILNGNGRVHLSLDSLFPDNHPNVKWVEVDSTADLVGYARTLSRDGEELYAMTASKKRSADLFVPHIAERVDQWFTRATVVNVDQNPGEGLLETPGAQVALAIDEPFAQDRFEFVERFGGTLPEDGIWARLREATSKVNMVGVEVFGTKDDTRQVAGLELLDNQRDNPNFLYVANNLYFTHIASDVNTFYTGIALVNVGDLEQSIRIFAYAADGSREGPKTITLGPNEKIVSLADSLLEGIGSAQETAWVMVEADSDIAGFEVFGTRDNKRLAGLEATNALRSELCYPYIDAEGETFHGVSLINPNEAANVMTLTLHDDQGGVLGTRQLTLGPGEKLVTLMADLFPEAFAAVDGQALPGWLSLQASLPTAGFELFTSKDNAQMGAILAQ